MRDERTNNIRPLLVWVWGPLGHTSYHQEDTYVKD